MFATDFFFQFVHFAREKFHRAATFSADHVMVAAAVVLVLVARDAIVKRNFAGQAAFGQKLQRAVHRGVTDARVFLLDQAMEFVHGRVVASFDESAKDGVALGGLLESDPLQVPMQQPLGLADHLWRQVRLVINALLQHGGKAAGVRPLGQNITAKLKLKFNFKVRGVPGARSQKSSCARPDSRGRLSLHELGQTEPLSKLG